MQCRVPILLTMKISLSIKFSIGRRRFVLGNLDVDKTSRVIVGIYETIHVRNYCRWLSVQWKVQTAAQAEAQRARDAAWDAGE